MKRCRRPVRNAIDFKAEAYRDPGRCRSTRSTSANPYLIPKTPGTAFFARLARDPVHFC